MIKYTLVSLEAPLNVVDDREKVQEFLNSFKCSNETDLEHFLSTRAITYDCSGFGKTLLLISEDNILLAFFTLAQRSLDIKDLSKKRRKKLLGNTPGKDSLTSYPCFLIGQLGRADSVSSEDLKGYIILQEAYNQIRLVQGIVGGNLLLLECREHMFGKFYEKQGFSKLDETPKEGLLTLYKKLNF